MITHNIPLEDEIRQNLSKVSKYMDIRSYGTIFLGL